MCSSPLWHKTLGAVCVPFRLKVKNKVKILLLKVSQGFGSLTFSGCGVAIHLRKAAAILLNGKSFPSSLQMISDCG